MRRDSCPAVAKMLEHSIRLLFGSKDLSQVGRGARGREGVGSNCNMGTGEVVLFGAVRKQGPEPSGLYYHTRQPMCTERMARIRSKDLNEAW